MFIRGMLYAALWPALNVYASNIPAFSLAPVDAPVIKDKKIIYTICLVTSYCPKDLWWYFDASGMYMVIEWYDRFIPADDTVRIEGALPVKEIEARNCATSLVPSKKKVRIFLRLKEEMHCDADCLGDTLKITLWKVLMPKIPEKRKKWNPFIVPLAVIAGTAGITVTILGSVFKK